MNKTTHTIYLGLLVGIVFISLITLIYTGISYYGLSLDERVYNPDNARLKPSGLLGHGFGIIEALAGIPYFPVHTWSYSGTFSYRF
jgi:hypothetical protein